MLGKLQKVKPTPTRSLGEGSLFSSSSRDGERVRPDCLLGDLMSKDLRAAALAGR